MLLNLFKFCLMNRIISPVSCLGGIFNIPIKTPEDFYVKVTKDLHQIKLMAFCK